MAKENANAVKPATGTNAVNQSTAQVQTAVKTETAQVEKVANPATDVINQQKAIDTLKAQLEKQLAKIARKNEIAEHREKFLETKSELLKLLEYINHENGFDSKNASVKFIPHNGEQAFTISNLALVKKFAEVLTAEIESKVKDIETELISE